MHRRSFLLSSLASSAVYAGSRSSSSALAEVFAAPSGSLPSQLREKLMRDPNRPQFHLLPRANWMNDPCAPRYFRGEYHVFFQYNPGAAVWGDMHWNHATSPDLIHWKHRPLALAPTPGSFDAFGIFTGSVLPGMTTPTVLYTGVTKSTPELETIRGEGIREVQCLATSTHPDLLTWTKLDKPVLESPPPGVKVTGFRDPCPWKDGDTWYLIVGSGFEKVGGAVLLYRSSDGRSWEYLHPLAQGKWNGATLTNPVDTGEMWECPDFFALGGKHVLLYSTERKVYWQAGTFDKRDLKFHAETSGLLDHGSYYAMKSMEDAKGRRILWGWVEETRKDDDLKAAGWAGSMALPRVLTLDAKQQLRMQVPPEFASLHRNTRTASGAQGLTAITSSLAAMPLSHRAGMIACTFKVGAAPCGIELRSGHDPAPLFVLKHDGSAEKPTLVAGDKSLALSPDPGGFSTLHLWLDGSVIEVFADDREALTARNYTTTGGDIQVGWIGVAESLKSVSVSSVTPISADRLTS